MSLRSALFCYALVLAPKPIVAQLHLIAGTPDPSIFQQFATTLYKVADDGTVRKLVELVPQKPGTELVIVSYDLRKAVIMPQGGNSPLVLDLNTATVVKQCSSLSAKIKDGLERSFYQWLSDVPGRGATFEWYVPGTSSDAPLIGASVQGMEIDPSVPCEKSFLDVPPTEMQYIVAHGTAGVGEKISPEAPSIEMIEDGNLVTGVQRPSDVSFGYQIPVDFRKGLGLAFARIVVSNSQIMVVGLVKDEKSTPGFLAFRKRDKTWHVIPSRNWSSWCVRGFGQNVAITETAPRRPLAPAASKTAEASLASRPESPGRSEWRSRESRLGPNIVESFSDSNTLYPGKLHLYDVETEKMFTIDTKQGDSEILLVENGTVYYRVSDRLYSAPLTEKGIGTARLLATDEVIRDVHRAFIKP